MAQQDRLQPSLLDRLTDDAPGEQSESRDRRVMSLQRLREAVLRDLAWLLNTADLACAEDLAAFPEVTRSVLNYGLPPLAGTELAGLNLAVVEKSIRQAIMTFEPRILPKTLKVKAAAVSGQMDRRALSFDIEGELWAQPVPLRLLLHTDIDLEAGTATVREGEARRSG